MPLADFILSNIEPILARWERFAHEVWPEPASTNPAELRDHAEAILRATVADMASAQSPAEQSSKAMGDGERSAASSRLDTASRRHGAGRVESGFRLKEVLAEYRALRASVIELWADSRPVHRSEDLAELTRFHEAIDQSLARAVDSFTDRTDQARQLYLAILGHDLRTPIAAMKITAEMIARRASADPGEVVERAGRVKESADAMMKMIDDLLDFTGSGLGSSMPLAREKVDLRAICRVVVDETNAAHPECAIGFTSDGDTVGQIDAARMRQVVSNLLGNAAQHGGSACEVDLHLRGEDDAIVLSIHNNGNAIPAEAIPVIFDPLRRSTTAGLPPRHRPGSIGLGLYIAHQIVVAHGGSIAVTSTTEAGTVFTVRLPRVCTGS